MKRIALVLGFVALNIISCRRVLCGCVPPPPDSRWKMTQKFGGVNPADVPLTDEQKNSILILHPNGGYSLTNTVTGALANGTYSQVDFNSIYGLKPRMIFSPALSILPDEYLVVVNTPNTTGIMKLADNNTDGYTYTLTMQ